MDDSYTIFDGYLNDCYTIVTRLLKHC